MGLVAWIDGRLIDPAQAALPLDDRGFTLADSLFETLRVRHGEPGLWSLHMARLAAGRNTLGLPFTYSDNDLADAVRTALAANKLGDAAVRITISAGSGPRGLRRPDKPRIRTIVTAAPLSPLSADGRVIVAGSTRRNEHSPLSRVKTAAAYPDHRLALGEAEAAGAVDALLQNTAGALVCATAANLIVCRREQAFTPRIEDGALPGTVRQVLIDRGLAQAATLRATDLATADRLLLVNALGVRSVWLDPSSPVASRGGSAAAILNCLNKQVFI